MDEFGKGQEKVRPAPFPFGPRTPSSSAPLLPVPRERAARDALPSGGTLRLSRLAQNLPARSSSSARSTRRYPPLPTAHSTTKGTLGETGSLVLKTVPSPRAARSPKTARSRRPGSLTCIRYALRLTARFLCSVRSLKRRLMAVSQTLYRSRYPRCPRPAPRVTVPFPWTGSRYARLERHARVPRLLRPSAVSAASARFLLRAEPAGSRPWARTHTHNRTASDPAPDTLDIQEHPMLYYQ